MKQSRLGNTWPRRASTREPNDGHDTSTHSCHNTTPALGKWHLAFGIWGHELIDVDGLPKMTETASGPLPLRVQNSNHERHFQTPAHGSAGHVGPTSNLPGTHGASRAGRQHIAAPLYARDFPDRCTVLVLSLKRCAGELLFFSFFHSRFV